MKKVWSEVAPDFVLHGEAGPGRPGGDLGAGPHTVILACGTRADENAAASGILKGAPCTESTGSDRKPGFNLLEGWFSVGLVNAAFRIRLPAAPPDIEK